MWPCYGVHIHIMCGTPCLCNLSASESSLHQLDFFLEIFLWTLVSDMRLSVSLSLHNLLLICFCYHCYTMLPTHSQLMCYPSTCADEWRPTARHCPLSLPRRKRWCMVSLIYTQKQSSNGPSPRNFLTVSGYFERIHTYCIMVLGWKKKKKKKKEDEQF